MMDMAGTHLSLMSLAILFFHSSEYVLAMWFHRRENVTLGSLLITKQYLIAMAFSYLEYLCEARFFPWTKEHHWITLSGIAMVAIGEIIRKTAIVTAGMAFTHLIRTRCDESHRLVTHGVYSLFRHPGYLGFLVWSVGTQVMLCNPVSTLAFALIVWLFFYKRIPYEEHYLRRFFGSRYDEYAQRVPSGLPFLS